MLRIRSRISVIQPDDDRFVVRANPTRRLLFGAIGALLLLAFFVGVDLQTDFERSSLLGTLFYSLLTLTCIAVAIVGRSITFSHAQSRALMRRTVAGIEIQRREVDLARVESVTLQSVRFLKESERPQAGVLNARYRNFVARRNSYFKLYLDLPDRREFLEDSTDQGELDQAGSALAEFVGVPFHHEEL